MILPTEMCRYVKINNVKNQTRIIFYDNEGDTSIGCCYLKNMNIYFPGSAHSLSDAEDWLLNGKDILLYT